jgi:tight adherence protein C
MMVAVTGGGPLVMLLASLNFGVGVFLVTRWLVQALRSEELKQGAQWRYDISRINELRRIDPFYRIFRPLIKPFAWLNRKFFRDSLPEIDRQLQAAGLPRFWLPEEYLARIELMGLFALPFYLYLMLDLFDLGVGLTSAVVATLLTVWLLRRRLAGLAARRLQLIKRRMPYLLDLLTLLMEAGATFLSALGQAVEEFHGHPVAEEFDRVLNDMNRGKTRAEAFGAMRDRLQDDEISSIIASILQGERLGTPLAGVFRTQADVLRLKRSQRAETVAGEAGVNMLFPATLVMMSAVLIILGPFLMNYLQIGLLR